MKAAGTGTGGFLSLSALNLGKGAGPVPAEGNLLITGALSVNAVGKKAGGSIQFYSQIVRFLLMSDLQAKT